MRTSTLPSASALREPDVVLSLALGDGRRATLGLRADSTCLAVEEEQVASWDLAGRPYALVRDGWTWRRALDGRLLKKGTGTRLGPRVRAVVPAAEAAPVVEAARADASLARAAVPGDDPHRPRALGRLGRAIAMDERALASDAAEFARVYRPIGLLPPDQYLAVVLQATEGCSWNGCTFCSSWREARFRTRGPAEFDTHVAAVRQYFGPSLALRRQVFLGSANALCAAPERIDGWLTSIARAFRVAPWDCRGEALRSWMGDHPDGVSGISAFVDAWTGGRHEVPVWKRFARLGLRRVYVGLETGDADLLRWLGKPGTPDDAVDLVRRLHEAGLSAGVIVLLGPGGAERSAQHVEATADALSRMELGPDDLVYASDLVAPPGSDYHRRAAAAGATPLDAAACRAQEAGIKAGVRTADPTRAPRFSRYDIREFVY